MIRRFKPALGVGALFLVLASAPGNAAGREPFFVDFVPHRSQLVIAYRGDPIVKLEYPELEQVWRFEGETGSTLRGVALSGNGNWLAASYGRGDLWVWDLETGEEQLQIATSGSHSSPVYLFHPTEDQLLVAQGGALRRWDINTASEIDLIRPVESVQRMSASGDGRYVAIAGVCRMGSVKYGLCVYLLGEDLVLSAQDPKALWGIHASEISDLAFTPDQRIAVTFPSRPPVFYPPTWTRLLSPAELRPVGSGRWTVDEVEEMPAFRSAPRNQLTALSVEGTWQVRVDSGSGELCLSVLDTSKPDGTFQSVECVPLP